MKSYDGYLYGKQILNMIDDMEMLFNFEMNVIAYFIKKSKETSFVYDCDERKIFIPTA